jgi:hypothetical protein
MDEEKKVADQFLDDLKADTEKDAFDTTVTEEPEKEVEETEEEKEVKHKNREFRRLEKRYQEEREAGIALAERVKVLSEVGKFREEVGDDHLKEVEAIFGTDTAEKLQATNILKKALSGMSEQATQKALEKLEESRDSESQAVRQSEQELDQILERVEDEHGIDMSNETNRKGYLTLLERFSSKDDDGNIKEFADADATAEAFLSSREKSSSRAKDLASRGMVRSGASSGTDSKLETDSNERWLRENGII